MLGRRGISMVETVLAFAILTAGFAMFARLFAYGLKGMARADEQVRAVAMAEKEVARLQGIGQTGDFVTLLAQDGRTLSESGLDLSVEVVNRDLYSPSSSWESPFAATGEARVLNPTTVLSVVRVRGPTADVTLPTVISDPRRSLRSSPAPLELVGSIPALLPRDGTINFEAHLYAANGNELPVTFGWYVVPVTGTGTVQPHRNGLTATFVNRTYDGAGNAVYTGGTCEFRVKAKYFGEEVWGPTVTINLAP